MLVGLTLSACSNTLHEKTPYWDRFRQNSIAWTREMPQRIVSPPVPAKDILLVRLKESLIALDHETGEVLWAAETKADGNINLEPLVLDNKVFVSEEGGCLRSFDLQSGSYRWSACPGDASDYTPTDVPVVSITHYLDKVYVTRFNWDRASYEVSEGDKVWSFPIPDRRHVFVINCGNNLCMDGVDSVIQLDPQSGFEVNEKALTPEIGPITSNGDYIGAVVGGETSPIVALEPETLEVLWTNEVEKKNDRDFQHADIVNDIIILTGQIMEAIDLRDGQTLWKWPEISAVGRPVFKHGFMYVRVSSDRILKININDGVIEDWLLTGDDAWYILEPPEAPGIDDQYLYFTTKRTVSAIEY